MPRWRPYLGAQQWWVSILTHMQMFHYVPPSLLSQFYQIQVSSNDDPVSPCASGLSPT
jgi:hypothetical protein